MKNNSRMEIKKKKKKKRSRLGREDVMKGMRQRRWGGGDQILPPLPPAQSGSAPCVSVVCISGSFALAGCLARGGCYHSSWMAFCCPVIDLLLCLVSGSLDLPPPPSFSATLTSTICPRSLHCCSHCGSVTNTVCVCVCVC